MHVAEVRCDAACSFAPPKHKLLRKRNAHDSLAISGSPTRCRERSLVSFRAAWSSLRSRARSINGAPRRPVAGQSRLRGDRAMTGHNARSPDGLGGLGLGGLGLAGALECAQTQRGGAGGLMRLPRPGDVAVASATRQSPSPGVAGTRRHAHQHRTPHHRCRCRCRPEPESGPRPGHRHRPGHRRAAPESGPRPEHRHWPCGRRTGIGQQPSPCLPPCPYGGIPRRVPGLARVSRPPPAGTRSAAAAPSRNRTVHSRRPINPRGRPAEGTRGTRPCV